MAPEIGDAPWVPTTQYQNAGVYSRYLEAVARQGLTPDGLRTWIRILESANVCTRTIAGYVWSLHKVASILFDQRFEWLYKTCLRLDQIAKTTAKKKNKSVAMAVDILQFGLTTIARAQKLGPEKWTAAQLYRDGLILVFGIAGPERLRALANVSLDDLSNDFESVNYAPSAIKTKIASVRVVPDWLLPLLLEWVTIWRPRHVKGTHRALWLGKGGGPLGASALVAAMKTLTETAPWAHPITPHRLRDAAATFLVDSSPDNSVLASLILNHRSAATLQEYTHTAERIEASRVGRAMIQGAAEALTARPPKRRRVSTDQSAIRRSRGGEGFEGADK